MYCCKIVDAIQRWWPSSWLLRSRLLAFVLVALCLSDGVLCLLFRLWRFAGCARAFSFRKLSTTPKKRNGGFTTTNPPDTKEGDKRSPNWLSHWWTGLGPSFKWYAAMQMYHFFTYLIQSIMVTRWRWESHQHRPDLNVQNSLLLKAFCFVSCGGECVWTVTSVSKLPSPSTILNATLRDSFFTSKGKNKKMTSAKEVVFSWLIPTSESWAWISWMTLIPRIPVWLIEECAQSIKHFLSIFLHVVCPCTS